MAKYQDEYWSEAASTAIEAVGKFELFTSTELDEIGKSLRISAECQSMAFGWDVADANLAASRDRELADLRKSLNREKNKVHCRECNGRGRIEIAAGPWVSNSQCWKCNGEGRHDP